MASPMNALLLKIANPRALTPKQFATLFDDFDFNGVATRKEMLDFCTLANTCMTFSNKSSDRGTAVFAMIGFTEIYSSAFFPKLDINIVAFQMMLRLMKPERVNQMEFGICGPAHFMVLLIKSKPIKYVSMAMDLLIKGRTTGDDGFVIEPDPYVADFDPAGSIPQADWLLAGSLRNAKTPIPFGKDRGEYGGTKSPDVFAYCMHAGYRQVISLACYKNTGDWLGHSLVESVYEQYHPEGLREKLAKFGKTYDPSINFIIACYLRSQGWRVLLKINSELLTFEPVEQKFRDQALTGNKFAQTRVELADSKYKEMTSEKKLGGIIPMQNVGHWVLAKDISVDGKLARLKVYTWGTQHTADYELKMEDFANAYGGFVAARG